MDLLFFLEIKTEPFDGGIVPIPGNEFMSFLSSLKYSEIFLQLSPR